MLKVSVDIDLSSPNTCTAELGSALSNGKLMRADDLLGDLPPKLLLPEATCVFQQNE